MSHKAILEGMAKKYFSGDVSRRRLTLGSMEQDKLLIRALAIFLMISNFKVRLDSALKVGEGIGVGRIKATLKAIGCTISMKEGSKFVLDGFHEPNRCYRSERNR